MAIFLITPQNSFYLEKNLALIFPTFPPLKLLTLQTKWKKEEENGGTKDDSAQNLSNLLTSSTVCFPGKYMRLNIFILLVYLCVYFILLCSLLKSLSLLFLFHFSSLFSNFGYYLLRSPFFLLLFFSLIF